MKTRKSTRKKKEPVEEPLDIEEDVQENDDAPEEEEFSSSTSSKKGPNEKQVARELRRKAKEDLRSRNMGLGLSISSQPEESNTKKHVVFGDDESFEESIDEHAGNDFEPDEHGDDDDDDDDDDAVEEVKSNIARDQVLKQRAMERETATISKLKSKSKKRNKTREEKKLEEVDEDDDFDEDFFAQVDSEMASNRHQSKKSRTNGDVPKGRHTTFVSAHDEAPAEPVQGNDNIELVVLGDNEEDDPEGGDYQERMRIVESKLGTEPSEAAKVFSRNALLNGSDEVGQARKSKSKEVAKANQQNGWKRSKKSK
mmetsp:Transcript_8940/g.13720  ORF Transcript_8940/g.13720 Transcript_8940/m.13720 type:complete len:312 (+) Transcript_8940:114-1049(+)